ncbi:cytochrome c oxidase assembly protein CtaG/Cox11 [Methylobacterium sp. 4-46]|uniref:cytochrome c oxidase assembly protein n=1 Tax=unclassified Methylobacterium TaxID=2615210 RepID=UPI000152CA8A|nr:MULTISPECIES: cytochrome c oxidase assembly protein [Methylobacterium]ACA16804.1 cytochrome c oxidase assembly protein CtaG/Cox11 [Methylobacterium sp. 4-46]WFT82499.1 cytochrome c oxidase assembly protein [Methylobacterium nodulans]
MTAHRSSPAQAGTPARAGIRTTLIACIGTVVGMTALAFASVPLYDLFCKTTGYDGTPLVGRAPSAPASDEVMTVHFDTNVSPSLPWRFEAEAPRVEAKLGATQTVFFRVTNTASLPTTGVATFNVQPGLMGGYFVKIQCFCFNEQTLKPGETIDVPVVFYVDPAVRTDPNTRDYAEMTLSYTYFPSKNGQPTAALATTSAGEPRPN